MIGLFDSGIGGLTVLKSLQTFLPQEPFIYLGDTARLPYGTKSSETISRYTQQNISFLNEKGVDLIISACHSASSAILQYKITGPVPLLNVIEPACTEAMQESKNKKIALMATQATVDAGQYHSLIQPNRQSNSQPNFELFSAPCPLLVPIVEAGWLDDEITNQIIERYTRPLINHGVDVIILGCTHFPLLKASIQKIVGPHIKLIDPGDCLAQQILDMKRPTGIGQKLHVYLTDKSPHFVKTAHTILPGQNLQLSQVDL